MNLKLLRRTGLMGMELGREGQLQVNNCHEYYCSAWSKLNTEIGPNTNPPQTFGPLSRGVEGRVVATSTLMAPEEAEKYEKKAGEFLDKFYSIHHIRLFKEWNCARNCTCCVSHWFGNLVPLASTSSVCPELSDREGISCLKFSPKH